VHNPKDIAQAYLTESTVDIETARLTNVNGLYSRTIHFAQESVEKVTKACLALREIFTRDHKTSTLFVAVFRNEIENVAEIQKAALILEKHGARTRFPLYQRGDLPLWVPSKVYGQEEARDALKQGEFIYNTLKAFLEKEIKEKY